MNPITKSQFTLGLDCIQKLRHSRDHLPQTTAENDMLRLLADGGAAVEALQRAIEPETFCGARDRESAVSESMAAIHDAAASVQRDRVRRSLYEVTIELDGFLARIDLLRVHADRIELVELKSKNLPDQGFLGRSGKIRSEWLRYIQDLAFQHELLRRWVAIHAESLGLPETIAIMPRLILINPSGRAVASDIFNRNNYAPLYSRSAQGVRVSIDCVSMPQPSSSEILVEVDAADAVEAACLSAQSEVRAFQDLGIAACMDKMKAIIASGPWPDPAESRAVACKKCEFRVNQPKLSGFAKCWGGLQTTPNDHVLALTRVNDKQLASAMSVAGVNARIENVPVDSLLASQRNHYDVVCSGQPFVTRLFAAAPPTARLRARVGEPVFFVDFECSVYSIPSRIGGSPYECIPFQFEGHMLPSPEAALCHRRRLDGFLELVNPDPRRAFVDALKAQFPANGPIYHWHQYEKTVLKRIRLTLESDLAAGKDDQCDPDRIEFIDSLVGVDPGNAGRLVDLLELANESFSHPAQGGSYSIKRVVPIAWAEQSIRAAFSPGHGAASDPECYDAKEDPYDGLPAPPKPILEAVGGLTAVRRIVAMEDDGSKAEEGGIRNGGMAMLAYHYVRIFGGADDPEIVAQFRRYCRLDSAAMVMVYALMRDIVPRWPQR